MVRIQTFTLEGDEVKIYDPDGGPLDGFAEWIQCHGDLACDTETTGKLVYEPGFKVRTVQFGDAYEAWVIPVEGNERVLKAVLNSGRRFLFHNAPYDVMALDRAGLVDGREFINKTRDSYIYAHLDDPRDRKEGGIGHGLKEQCAEHVDENVPDVQKELHEVFRTEYKCKVADGWKIIDIRHPKYMLYAGLDPILAWRLARKLRSQVENSGQAHLVDFEHRLEQITTRMILRGIPVDVPYAEQLSRDLTRQSEKAQARAAELGLENVNADAQIAAALQRFGWEPVLFTPKSQQPKVDAAVLEKLVTEGGDAGALAKAVLEAKHAAKRRESYVDAVLRLRDENDRVHPMIASLRARTARMSISTPPLQQLPADDWVIRRMMVADPGFLVIAADFKAVEMRVLAALARVHRMLEAILNGEDLHSFTARLVFPDEYTDDPDHNAADALLRSLCKRIGFGKVYGGGAATLSRLTGIPIADVKAAVKEYDRVYPEITRKSRIWQAEAKEHDYTLRTPTGRRLPVDENRLYAVTNYKVQSASRDLYVQSLFDLVDVGLEQYLWLPVHDETVGQAPRDVAEEVAHEFAMVMSHEDFHGVPIETDYKVCGPSWGHGYMKEAATAA